MSPLRGPIGLPMERQAAPAPMAPPQAVRVGLLALPVCALVALAALARDGGAGPWPPGQPIGVAAVLAVGLGAGFVALSHVLPLDAPRWTHVLGPALAVTGAVMVTALAVRPGTGTEATDAIWHVWALCARVAFALGGLVCGVALQFGEHPAPVGIGLAAGGVLWAIGAGIEPTVLGAAAFGVSSAWLAWSAWRPMPTPAA